MERRMASTNQVAEISALVGDPARAAMLAALLDGRALTATELSSAAGVTPQTTSSHLARLTAVGLLAVEQQGRHRYHRLASKDVARMLEGIMRVAAGLARSSRPVVVGPRDQALRAARTCYDHLAGRLGVGIADALTEGGHVELDSDGGIVTARGIALFRGLGIDTGGGGTKRSLRVLCRPCLDWSERRPHLAGTLGAALCAHCLDHGWIRRATGTRAVDITPQGRRMFREKFGVRDT
jgi:DNA-binding transcriptional ArsR family regulator